MWTWLGLIVIVAVVMNIDRGSSSGSNETSKRTFKIGDTVNVGSGETLSASYSFNRTGSLRILVTPWAEVYVDGQHLGQTPMDELEVPVGLHSVSLRHPTLGEKSEVVEIRRNESTVLKVEM